MRLTPFYILTVIVVAPLMGGCAQLGLIFQDSANQPLVHREAKQPVQKGQPTAQLATHRGRCPQLNPSLGRKPGDHAPQHARQTHAGYGEKAQAYESPPVTNELAGALDLKRDQHEKKGSSPDEPENKSKGAVKGGAIDGSKDKTQEPTQPAKVAYTTPGVPYQQISLLSGTMALAAMPEVLGAGSEFSQALVTIPEGVAGRAGLTAPSTLAVQSVVVGRPGLQEGLATGLSFASRDTNIFKAQANPLSGPNGVCHELVGAGFSKDHAACTRRFRH